MVGIQFNEDRLKTSDYPKTVNYRCINYRKYEKARKSRFYNALLTFLHFIQNKRN